MVAQIDTKFIIARPWKLWPRMLAYALFEGRPLTTRGRWINPLVFAGYRLWSVLPLRKRDLRPIFIMGLGRSGTTLLGTILALHRDVGYLNEPKALWHAALGDDDLIGSYSVTAGRYKMGTEDAKPAKIKRLKQFYQAFLDLSFSRRVVDKYPELLFRNGLVDAAFPDAQKIILLRNGADFCQSVEKWSKANGDQQADWWGRNGQKWQILIEELIEPDRYFSDALPVIRNLTRQTDRAAIEWIVTMREVDDLRSRPKHGGLFIHYEDLLDKPQQVLREVLEFCGLPPDRVMSDYGQRILKTPTVHAAPVLHPEIQLLFDGMMQQFGYLKGPPT